MNRSTALLDWAFSQPRKDCIVTDTERYSYAEVRAAVKAAATALADRVRSGTRVGLFIDSTPNFILYEYAVFYLGGVVTPINRAMKQEEVQRLVERLGISVVVCDTPLDLGPEVATHLVTGEFDVPTVTEYVAPAQLGIDDPAMLLQTSGSTGEPKGVLLAQRNLAANYDPTYRWIGVGKDDTILLALPIFNTYALNQGINMMAMSGASMRLLRRFSPDAVAEALRDSRPTFLPMVPTMLARLRQADVRYDGPIKVGIGAAPSPTEIAADAWAVFPRAHLYLGYGLTEATAIASLNHIGTAADHHDDFTSTGPIVSGIEVRIDEPSGDDQRGEILIKGDSVLRGYVGTDEPVPVEDGWLHTGDVGFFKEGRLTIVDRIRELIIRGGQNIYPGELEKVLTSHPAVLEAAVVGRPDQDLGEVPVAFVVPRPGFRPSPDELRDWTKARLAAFKVPAEVVVQDNLPRTPTGKIQKRELRAYGR
ncbi:long-chain acyl-CoA synthetase [Micromonospora pallida]|uniref:Long-chain acyl-CoA synthetase n=1 Tax=Micromonospora pallida TaxID=145854 RepID=A0A1C6RSR5_9ACTN|nr:class I adenylate-forming enzyme family protein [Micromonospora pallida]SCL20198.1 long-chain acyl-CoA synthetase [Micromonospora pallida]